MLYIHVSFSCLVIFVLMENIRKCDKNICVSLLRWNLWTETFISRRFFFASFSKNFNFFNDVTNVLNITHFQRS